MSYEEIPYTDSYDEFFSETPDDEAPLERYPDERGGPGIYGGPQGTGYQGPPTGGAGAGGYQTWPGYTTGTGYQGAPTGGAGAGGYQGWPGVDTGRPDGFPGEPGGFPDEPGGAPSGPGGAPLSPPPSFTPPQLPQAYAIDPGSIGRCRFQYVYIWQTNGQQYWIFLTFVGRDSIAGYRWFGYGPFGYWVYFGLDLDRVEQFYCSR